MSAIFLSTPSARRATWCASKLLWPDTYFYPRPPRGGRPVAGRAVRADKADFYPRPPRGGRQNSVPLSTVMVLFLSTPSARRATARDGQGRRLHLYFYPRPPRGGRRIPMMMFGVASLFLSTPSARRATGDSITSEVSIKYFYPRPPRGGRPFPPLLKLSRQDISIHALREEGCLLYTSDAADE